MDDMNKTIAPRRESSYNGGADEPTMPGIRNRKNTGRYQVGELITGRYKVLSELGQGGMGIIYRCFDEIAGIEVALKMLPPELSRNDTEMEDFRDNFQLVSGLIHQNIAVSKNLEKDEMTGNFCLVMEYCAGEDLRRWLRRKRREGSLTIGDVLPIITQVAEALDFAHSMGIIHRDIKPGNIMTDPTGKIKVLDFGLAAKIHSSMTQVSAEHFGTSGTGPYMAPEQWRGKQQGAAADQYALAVVTYEMLAGHLPFESTDAAVLRAAVLSEDAEALQNVPGYVQNAIQRAMSKDPADRFANCTEFVSALSGRKIRSAGNTGHVKYVKWCAAAAIILLAAAAGCYALYSFKQNAAAKKMEEIQKQKQLQEQEKLRIAQQEQEKALALAQTKLLRERELKARLESEARAEKVKKTELMLSKVITINRNISAANYDRAQGFGKYIDIVEQNIAAAGKVMTDDPDEAVRLIKAAEDAAKWITANAQLRKDAELLQSEMLSKKQRAIELESKSYASIAYAQAESTNINALAAYEAGNFSEARSLFKSASAAYTRAAEEAMENLIRTASEAKQWQKLRSAADRIHRYDSAKADKILALAAAGEKRARLDELLNNCRSAISAKQWQKACEYASDALKIDENCQTAKELLAVAKHNRRTSIEITAAIDGKTVPAVMTVNGKQHTLPYKGWLDTGVFNAVFSYQQRVSTVYTVRPEDTVEKIALLTGFSTDAVSKAAGQDKLLSGNRLTLSENAVYTSSLSLKADWQGMKNFCVQLKKEPFSSVVLPGNIKLELVKFSAGSFIMGSPENESGRDNDEVQHKGTLSDDFYLGKYEITQEQYQSVMHNSPSRFKGAKLPVEQVSLDDALLFCRKLNKVYSGKIPAGYTFTLPTESQWEYACRAGSLNNSNLSEIAWFKNNSGGRTHTVGSKQKSPAGLYDMHGNVWEWCLDRYNVYQDNTTDPVGYPAGMYRIFRGGSWNDDAVSCRPANRGGSAPSYKSDTVGFRVALVRKK